MKKEKYVFCILKLLLFLRDYGKSKIVVNLIESVGWKFVLFFGEILDN